MCSQPKTSNRAAGLLRGRTSTQRGNASKDSERRRPTDADPHHQRKRTQRKARAHLAKIAAGTARILETGSAIQLLFPWQDAGHTFVQQHDPESMQAGGPAGEDPQGGHAAHFAEGVLMLQ